MLRSLFENAFSARQRWMVIGLATLWGIFLGCVSIQDEDTDPVYALEAATVLRRLDQRLYQKWYDLRNQKLRALDLEEARHQLVLVLIDDASLRSEKVFDFLGARNLLDEESQLLYSDLKLLEQLEASASPLGQELQDDELRSRLEGHLGFDSQPIDRLLELARLAPADRRALRRLPWPIPRAVYGELVRRLKRAGATTIALDVLFQYRGVEPRQDALLAQALAVPEVVIPCSLDVDHDLVVARRAHPSLTSAWTKDDFLRRSGFTLDVGDDRLYLKLVHAAHDLTGRPLRQDGKPRVDTFYSFPLVIMAHHLEIAPEDVVARSQIATESRLFMDDRRMDVTSGLLNYASSTMEKSERLVPTSFATQVNEAGPGVYSTELFPGEEPHSLGQLLVTPSLEELLEIPEDELPTRFDRSDRFIALVGVTATGGQDRKTTILGSMFGPEILANGLVNLVLGNFNREPPHRVCFALIAGSALLIGLLAAFLNPWLTAAAAALMVVGLPAGNYLAFVGRGFAAGGLLLPYFAPLAAFAPPAGLAIAYHAHVHRRRTEKILQLFKEVCPVHDLAGLLGEGLKLGGKERELSILFSDLRGYTSFAEKLDSVTVLNTLNQYFGAVGHIFERYGGFVFDYQGDAQMVVFGLVPASQPNHALAACKAGVAMIATLEDMRTKWLAVGQNIPETGVGVCTGLVSFGVLGTEQHKQYVAIGDPTNTASRVQGKSAELNAPVLIAESTFQSAGPELLAEPLEPIQLKGKRDPLPVYRVKIRNMIESGLVTLGVEES